MAGMPASFTITHYNGPLFAGADVLARVAGAGDDFTAAEEFFGPAGQSTLVSRAVAEGAANIVAGRHGAAGSSCSARIRSSVPQRRWTSHRRHVRVRRRPGDQPASIVATDGAVTGGPYPEAIGGFTLVDVPSREEALQWAARIAVACRCALEVREIGADPELDAMLRQADSRR
jgi:hypothetical protein